MAERIPTTLVERNKSTSSTTKVSRRGGDSGQSTSPAPGKKTANKSSGTFVKSRYLQAAEKSALSKSSSLNESACPTLSKASGVKPKVGPLPRRTMAPPSLATSTLASETEPSVLGESILQSTFSDGHCVRPQFDISFIKDKMVTKNQMKTEINDEEANEIIEMETLMLAFLAAKIESNTAKLKQEAEERLLMMTEEVEALHKEVYEKKRRFLLLERERLRTNSLDIQAAALTPVVECTKEFSESYRSLSTAVDSTLHELPVNNFYIDGDRRRFLDEAVVHLKESETLLRECTDDSSNSFAAVQCLKDLKCALKELNQECSGSVAGLQELSSLLYCHTSLVQQATEEEQLGLARTQELSGLKN